MPAIGAGSLLPFTAESRCRPPPSSSDCSWGPRLSEDASDSVSEKEKKKNKEHRCPRAMRLRPRAMVLQKERRATRGLLPGGRAPLQNGWRGAAGPAAPEKRSGDSGCPRCRYRPANPRGGRPQSGPWRSPRRPLRGRLPAHAELHDHIGSGLLAVLHEPRADLALCLPRDLGEEGLVRDHRRG